MSNQAGGAQSLGSVRQPGKAEWQAFAEMYDAHAACVFDYCHGIVGDRERAAAATQATLIAAHSLAACLREPERRRAWLMALARRECQDSTSERAVARAAASHSHRELAEALAYITAAGDDVTDDDTTAEPTVNDGRPAATQIELQQLSAEQREMLDLIHRYGISATELPAILGIDAASAAELLGDAEARLTDAGLERFATVPLIALPASILHRTLRAVLDPSFRSYREAVAAHAEHLAADGFPLLSDDRASSSRRRLLRVCAVLACALLAPAALGWAGYTEFSGHGAGKSRAGTGLTSTSPASGSDVSGIPSPPGGSGPGSRGPAAGSSAFPGGHVTQPAGRSPAQYPQPPPATQPGGHQQSPSQLPSLSSPPSTSPTGSPAPSPSATSPTSTPSVSP